MKKLILLLFFISFIVFAKTRAEAKSDLKSGLSSFATSHTKKHSKSSDDDSSDSDSDSSSDSDDNKTSSSNLSYDSKDISNPFSFGWFWDFLPNKDNYKKIELIKKERKLLYTGISYNYQHWTPTGINNAKTDTTELSFARIELSALYNALYFSYESSFKGINLEQQRQLLKIRNKAQSGWERFLGEIVMPFIIKLGTDPFAKIYFKYDYQVFISTVTTLENKNYIPRDEKDKPGNEEIVDGYYTIKSGEKIITSTLFKDYELGLKMDYFPNLNYNLGIFYLAYNKPYSLTIDGAQYSQDIYDTDFSAAGVFMGASIFTKHSYLSSSMKLGGGTIRFVGLDTTVSDLIPDSDYSTAYFQFNLAIGLHYKIVDNLKFEGVVKSEYRSFYLSKPDSNKDDDIDDSDTKKLNNDFILTAYVSLSYSF